MKVELKKFFGIRKNQGCLLVLLLVLLYAGWGNTDETIVTSNADQNNTYNEARESGQREPRAQKNTVQAVQGSEEKIQGRDPFNLTEKDRKMELVDNVAKISDLGKSTVNIMEQLPGIKKIVEKKKVMTDKLVLKGILAGPEQKIALIESGKESFSCRIGTVIKDYEVLTITDTAVRLKGRDGEELLQLGQ